MKPVAKNRPGSARAWAFNVGKSWDQFLFSPADPATLGLIRILTGAMLFYTHFVWTFDLTGFFGDSAWLSKEFVYRFHDSPFGWSHLYWIDNTAMLWACHLAALCVFLALTLGFRGRTAAVFSYLLTVSYAHRASGALFGLDQINAFLAMYLAVGPCADAFSVDNWLKKRKARPTPGKRVSANIAIRLIQIHLCIVYLFAGLGKLLGASWWDGTALWGVFANYEYQTIDMTWLAGSIVLVNIMTHVTLFWEVSYAFLIWNRITRPVILVLAIPLHMGIALGMGMVTFGLIMLIANLSFVSPEFVRHFSDKFTNRSKPAGSAGSAAHRIKEVGAETSNSQRNSLGEQRPPN